jgi:hypothetical protein
MAYKLIEQEKWLYSAADALSKSDIIASEKNII